MQDAYKPVVFQRHTHQLRTILIDRQPWFVAHDFALPINARRPYAAWQAQKGGLQAAAPQSSATSAQSEWPDVKSAWCNPRMDDDCYINNKKVPVAELGKWLPTISESNVDQLGGYCETILCFDSNDQPLGYLLQ